MEANGRPILLHSFEGQLYAVDDGPHMGASLKGTQVTDDGTIVCPRYHSAFDSAQASTLYASRIRTRCT